MITDKELLDMAASALYCDTAAQMLASGWNPLVDDAEAFRLMVALNIHIRQVISPYGKEVVSAGYAVNEFRMDYAHTNDDDLFVATRRAIVRAAAEIWRLK